MGAFTPSLDEVRAIYASGTPAHHVSIAGSYAEFDRVIEEVRAEARAQAFQAVRDAAELEPEERDGPDMISPATLYITVDKLNGLETSHDGMDWIRITATDYTNELFKAKAESLREAADALEAHTDRNARDAVRIWLRTKQNIKGTYWAVKRGKVIARWLRARAHALVSTSNI